MHLLLDELHAALLQATVILGITGVSVLLYLRFRKPHFFWWAVAWGLYALRLAAIISFLASNTWSWLYWHQVATGWAALGLLWAALVFSRQLTLKPGYVLVLLFQLLSVRWFLDAWTRDRPGLLLLSTAALAPCSRTVASFLVCRTRFRPSVKRRVSMVPEGL